MFGVKNISNRTFFIILTIQAVLCLLWHIFFPQFYKITYLLFAIFALTFLCFVFRNKKSIWLFIKDNAMPKTANTLLSIIMLLTVVTALNYAAYKNEYKFDLTRDKINTLSDQTIKILKNLDENIHYIAFIDQATQGAHFRNAMDKYRYYSDRISYQIIDPNREPLKARAYNVVRYGTIIALKDKDETRTDFMTEEALTNVIIKLTRKEKKQIYFLTGHMERDIDSSDPESYSAVKDLITGQGYLVDKLNILNTGKIPPDSHLLIIAGPKRSFFDKEVKIITDYIKNGSTVLVLSDPSMPDKKITPDNNVNRVLSSFGLKLNNDVVVDPASRLFGLSDAMPMVQDYDASSAVTAGFSEPTIYPFAQSIDALGVDTIKYNLYKLCRTSASSWGEVDTKTGKISFDKERDRAGPLDLCVSLVGEKEDGVNIIVFGNSSFVSNQYISHVANSDIFMNAVSFLLKDEDLLAIRPKAAEGARFNMPASPAFAFVSVYILPFAVLITGVIYWHRRRRK